MAIYNGKHCVFEQVGLDNATLVWNAETNVDGDNAYNDWNISNMRTTHLPARLLLLSNALQDNLSNTTIQTATNGNNGTLVNTSDKLFLAAEKEMKGTRQYSVQQEFDALTTCTYYTTHTTNSDRVKKVPNNTAQMYWLRSTWTGSIGGAMVVINSGAFSTRSTIDLHYVSPCFAF